MKQSSNPPHFLGDDLLNKGGKRNCGAALVGEYNKVIWYC